MHRQASIPSSPTAVVTLALKRLCQWRDLASSLTSDRPCLPFLPHGVSPDDRKALLSDFPLIDRSEYYALLKYPNHRPNLSGKAKDQKDTALVLAAELERSLVPVPITIHKTCFYLKLRFR